MNKESMYNKSTMILWAIKHGESIRDFEIPLINLLLDKGFIIQKSGISIWPSSSYNLTHKAEKTLLEYNKLERIREGIHPSKDH